MDGFTRVIGHMVTRNEKARYLASTVPWTREITDRFLVYDDRSNDGTFGYLVRAGIRVTRRGRDVCTFAADESRFRAAGWRQMELAYHPTRRDWILCLDADELLVAADPSATRHALTDVIEQALDAGVEAVTFPVHEIWGFDDHTPMRRVDGWWGDITATRLVRWRPDGLFAARTEGGGSVPTSWQQPSIEVDDLALMHLGYARPEDRQAKHDRYSQTTGHNPQHIASILQHPSLVPDSFSLQGVL